MDCPSSNRAVAFQPQQVHLGIGPDPVKGNIQARSMLCPACGRAIVVLRARPVLQMGPTESFRFGHAPPDDLQRRMRCQGQSHRTTELSLKAWRMSWSLPSGPEAGFGCEAVER